MRKYSNSILDDNNFDIELEELAKYTGIELNKYDNFLKKLDSKYECQSLNGFGEWVKYEIKPNKGSDFRQAYQVGKVAYEFENGFIVFDFETIL